MEIVSPGIIIFRDYFLRGEEVIELAEFSQEWREGTAGNSTNKKIRITDIHDLDPKTELHEEILQTYIDGMNEYVSVYKAFRIEQGEPLRIARYKEGGFYSPHVDSRGSERTLSGIMYLNSDFEGGDLVFPEHNIKITPSEGMLVLFPSNALFVHESTPITKGTKYAVVSWFK